MFILSKRELRQETRFIELAGADEKESRKAPRHLVEHHFTDPTFGRRNI
jgi:hypothetical protein